MTMPRSSWENHSTLTAPTEAMMGPAPAPSRMRASTSVPKPLPNRGTSRVERDRSTTLTIRVGTQPNRSQQKPPTTAPRVTKSVKATMSAPVAAPRLMA